MTINFGDTEDAITHYLIYDAVISSAISVARLSELMENLWLRFIRNNALGFIITLVGFIFLPRFTCALVTLVNARAHTSFLLFVSLALVSLFFLFSRPWFIRTLFPLLSVRLCFFLSRYTFDKVIAVHYPGRSFMAVIYDYYYCTVMVAAIAWLPHIEKLFLRRKRTRERYTSKVAATRFSPPPTGSNLQFG